VSKLSERRREIRAMDLPTAQRELAHLRRQLFELRLQHERGEVKNNRQFPQTKADIARLMYHIGELQHAAQLEAEGALVEPEATETSETTGTTEAAEAAETTTDEANA
jgi:large subunit ribosomal protein L29